MRHDTTTIQCPHDGCAFGLSMPFKTQADQSGAEFALELHMARDHA